MENSVSKKSAAAKINRMKPSTTLHLYYSSTYLAPTPFFRIVHTHCVLELTPLMHFRLQSEAEVKRGHIGGSLHSLFLHFVNQSGHLSVLLSVRLPLLPLLGVLPQGWTVWPRWAPARWRWRREPAPAPPACGSWPPRGSWGGQRRKSPTW